ncbi:MAG: WecB/TagA/CpsF family glycosyltransferase [Methyloglobulus sp.]|nr:WecB/TagA/CpsF family glycosyltransferase [Methyloglobulus sp.]
MDIDKDFSRNIWCILGLPFDAIDLDQTANEIISTIAERRSCILATPNLNFLCGAQTNAPFRQSVINSDLSIVDGFPIVLVAKLLDIPIPERVAGSSLIEYLYHRKTTSPIKVFFFGGADSAGKLACQNINKNPAGLVAVGHYTPGFGSVAEMSTPNIIDYVKQYDIDLLIVSLGAQKGQAWIEENKHQLNAHVMSHLGAVINFFAGSVQRAPNFAQRYGMEWLWRIYQEPTLWRRYYYDGKCFIRLMCASVIPYWLWLKFNRTKPDAQTVEIVTSVSTEDRTLITLSGSCCQTTLPTLRQAFKKSATENRNVILDFAKVTLIDAAFLGLCLILQKHLTASGRSLTFINPNKDVRHILKWQKMNDLLADM